MPKQASQVILTNQEQEALACNLTNRNRPATRIIASKTQTT